MRPVLILPIGTQIVSRVEVRNSSGEQICVAGSVGRIVEAPSDGGHSYRVQFLSGVIASLKRHEMSIRKDYQRDMSVGRVLGEYDLYGCVIYRCVVGSRAFGLSTDESDTDLRGVYLPPPELEWSLYGVPEQLEDQRNQECYWELKKFLVLALKANPNVLECLYTPLVVSRNEVADELLSMREAFLSRLVYQTYNGYVMSQFKKLEQDLRQHGEVRWKHCCHLIRLLISGIVVLKEGFVRVDVGEHRERLLAIKRGEVEWKELNDWRLRLHREFDEAYERTRLPERPDYERVNDFLVRTRFEMCRKARSWTAE